MTSRQRVEAALSHREPDRTPVFEYVLLSPVADQLLGRTYGGDPVHWHAMVAELGWAEAVRRNAADRVELALRLGHDLLYVTPNPPPPVPATPAPAHPAPPPTDPVERLQLRHRAVSQWPDEPPGETLQVYREVKAALAERDADLPILAPAYAHGVWTDVDLLQTIALAPEVAREHYALATRRSLARIEAYLALGLNQIGIGGDFAGNRLLISPASYRDLIVPEVATLARRIHAGGAWAVNASDGDLWPVIDDFLLGCEVDAYLEIDDGAGMDLRRLKERFGARITCYGSLDCGRVLSFATPDEVRSYTIGCLEAGLGDGGHILCASNAITGSVPLDNYLAVIEAYRDFWGLPKLVLD
jgi:uroporphyrinogen decarboxylase